MKLADRRFQIDSSGIRKIFDLASKMKDPINLSIGLPDYDVPDTVKDSAIDAIRAGKNRYTLTGGTPQLREALREYYRQRNYNFDDVIVTGGTSGALLLAMLVLLNPGDEVLVPDPYFVMYKHLTKFVGAKPVFVDTYPDFKLTREKLEAACTPRTKLLIANTPANPTGVVMDEDECRMVAEFADEKGIALISDEIYEHFSFDGKFASPSRYAKEPITICGLSKNVAMTGWRLGWMSGPDEFIKAVSDVQQYTFVCANSIAQEAALTGLEYDMAEINSQYKNRRDRIYQGLLDAGYNVSKPGGAFYIFPEAPNGDGDQFVAEAIENNLLIVPGSVFSEKNTHFRISFAASMDKLEAGIEVLTRLAEKYGVKA